jgi:PadR family transcriptional regulator PadR
VVLVSGSVGQDRYSQWLRGVLDLCVLALVLGRESYGYEITRSLVGSGLGPIQGGTLYPILTRLRHGGLIAARWRGGESGPARKYYRITPAGEVALRAAVADWNTFTADIGASFQLGPVGTNDTSGSEATVVTR